MYCIASCILCREFCDFEDDGSIMNGILGLCGFIDNNGN